MKVFTSYFYQIRNFAPYQIPVSTAAWDPKWFHDNKGNDNVFVDKNGVINGIRLCALQPKSSLHGLCKGQDECNVIDKENCSFLSGYSEQLRHLNFIRVWDNLSKLADAVQEMLGFTEEPEIVLMVYEAPNNKCSERQAIQSLFKDNDVPCNELVFK